MSGNAVFGAYFEGNMGYRNDKTSGVATGEGEQTGLVWGIEPTLPTHW